MRNVVDLMRALQYLNNRGWRVDRLIEAMARLVLKVEDGTVG